MSSISATLQLNVSRVRVGRVPSLTTYSIIHQLDRSLHEKSQTCRHGQSCTVLIVGFRNSYILFTNIKQSVLVRHGSRSYLSRTTYWENRFDRSSIHLHNMFSCASMCLCYGRRGECIDVSAGTQRNMFGTNVPICDQSLEFEASITSSDNSNIIR